MPSYHDIRNSLNTGDLVLFSGKGGISTGIKWVTGSKWSHIGMVLRLPEWDFVLLWESTTLSDIADLDTGIARKGVQIVPLSERIRHYDGEVSVRALSPKLNIQQVGTLRETREEFKGRKYETSEIELIKAAYDGPFGRNTEDLRSLFCSELVAEAYQRMGLLSEEKPANEYTPADFTDRKELTLLDNYSLSDETVIRA